MQFSPPLKWDPPSPSRNVGRGVGGRVGVVDKTKIELLSGTGGGEAGATLGGRQLATAFQTFSIGKQSFDSKHKSNEKKDHHVARWVQGARFHVPGARWDES